MTDRAEIERLLNATGRTLEGLPKLPEYRERGLANTTKAMRESGITEAFPFMIYQTDVIELLVGALRDALSERDAALAKVPKWISAKDRQPAPLEKVWMYSKKYNSMFVGMRGLQNPEHIYVESGPDLRLNDISYWMPKPQKPKAPEEEG